MSLEQTLKDKNVELLNFVWVGLDGRIRSKGAYVDYVDEMVKSGIGLTKAMMSFTPMDSISPFGSFGPHDDDVFLIPDVDSVSVFPPVAMVMCDLYNKGLPWEYDPRSLLKRVIEKVRDEFGYDVKSSFEVEFYLVKDGKPMDEAKCFDPTAFNANPVILDLTKSLSSNGIDVLRVIKEYGPGQYEIDPLHKDPLKSSDEFVTIKQAAKKIASKYGVYVNFMPKPFNKLAGSGLHLNLSFWKGESNSFYSQSDSLGLSELAYNFIAGIIDHAKALTAISAPTINSYKRLVPSSWAPTKIAYGSNNKSAMLRVPTPYPNLTSVDRRVEFRVPDPSANPYLLTSAFIMAGLDGIERGLKPPNPVNENAYQRRDIEDLPRNLREALQELRKDFRLREKLGNIVDEFINVKMAEVEEYESYVSDWEYEVYHDI
ncbi:glutamine synthetase family protein [Acidianus sp. RZ1]|uniref:glutamine synthetase family protein n=1 Tax=Acidianus sp. RZ1 TaxID=1540082 RepID=UPI0014931016|nr:glutamine synthetase [Acidianus sp. RZ1]